MEKNLGRLHQQLEKTKREKSNAVSFQEEERLRQDIQRLENAIAKINETDRYARIYEGSERNKQDNNRDFNPALNMMFNVYVDGKKEKLKGNDAIVFDKSGNLHTVQIPKRNTEQIERLKAEVAKINAQMDALKTSLLNDRRTQKTDVEDRSKYSYLEKELEKAKKALREEVRGHGSMFFVPLTKIGRHATSAQAFMTDYFEGPLKSFLNVEDNIDILIALLLGGRKEMKFEGERFNILSYKWRKSEYAPFGYQSSRGKVTMRAFFNEVNLDGLKPSPIPEDVAPPAAAAPDDAGAQNDAEDEPPDDDQEGGGGSATDPGQVNVEAALAIEASNENDLAATKKALENTTKNNEFLADVQREEERIEKVYSSTITGGDLKKEVYLYVKAKVNSSIGNVDKQTAIKNAVESYSHTNPARYVRNVANDLLGRNIESVVDINLTNHVRFRKPAGAYPMYKLLYQEYIYEYLAYRFSIYHNFFKTNVWSLYSVIPYFIYDKRNSIVLKGMVPYAPNREIRDATVKLANLWNDREIKENAELATSLYETQMMYLKRMRLDLLRRLDLFRPLINYVILKALLKEIRRCSKKEKVKDCITRAQKILFTDYAHRSDYTFRYKVSAAPEWQGSTNFPCGGSTKVEVPPLWAANLRTSVTNGRTVAILVNGAPLPSNAFTLDNTNIPDISTTDLDLDYNVAVEKLEKMLEAYKKNPQIVQALSLNHVLPDMCLCMYNKAKLLQQERCHKNMLEIFTDWEVSSNTVQQKHNEVKKHFKDKESCYTQLAQTGEDNVECSANLNETYALIEPLVIDWIGQVMLPHPHAFANFYEGSYPEYYQEFEQLHKQYQKFFKKYQKRFEEMTSVLAEVTAAEAPYERTVAQIDYLGEAYTLLLDIRFPMKTVATMPTQSEEDIRDYKTVVENLATLCDIVENYTLRGYVPNMLPVEPTTFEGDAAEEKRQHELLLQVERYSEPKSRAVPKDRLAFAKAYSELDPAYVLFRNNVTNLTADLMEELLYNARLLCAEGQFLQALQSCWLIFCFPLDLVNQDKPFFDDAKSFFEHVLPIAGKSPPRYIHYPLTEDMQKGVFKHLNTDEKKVTNLIFQQLGGYKNMQLVYAHGIAKKFMHVDKNKNYYHKARVNFLCLQLYLQRWPMHKVFTEPLLKAEDLTKILRFFPEKGTGQLIVASIQNAMLHVDVKETHKYVADFLISHRKKKRLALNDVTPTSKKNQVKEALAPILGDIERGLKKLKYIKTVIKSAKYEKEDMFPLPGVYSTFMRWATTKPYVDGNYSLNVKVDLFLSSQDLRELESMDCDEKYRAASAIWQSFFPA